MKKKKENEPIKFLKVFDSPSLPPYLHLHIYISTYLHINILH